MGQDMQTELFTLILFARLGIISYLILYKACKLCVEHLLYNFGTLVSGGTREDAIDLLMLFFVFIFGLQCSRKDQWSGVWHRNKIRK